MIKLLSLIKEQVGSDLPDVSLATYLLDNNVESISDTLYHGTPLIGLQEILTSGIYGTQHGEVAEYESFSTSPNSNVLSLFSENDGRTGIEFEVKNIRVIVLNNILTYLVTRLPGSGMDVDVDEEELERFSQLYKIPRGGYKNHPYLPYNYLSSIGVDAFMYEYVYDSLKYGRNLGHNDESEICFVGNGINKLNNFINGIYVDGVDYDIEDKKMALQDIESRI